jgi:hypothetical protein
MQKPWLQNKLPPIVDINKFNSHKVSKEFIEDCQKAAKIFNVKKEESQVRDLPPAQPHDIRC